MTNRATRHKRAQQAAKAARLRARRRRSQWISVAAVAVLLVAGLIGVAVWQAGRPGDYTVPAAATADETGLAVGDGPVEVEVYLDFLCPSCRQFDQASRPVLDEYVADGTVTLVYRPIAILDSRTTTQYSTRSGGAAGCAADGGEVDAFVGELLAAQPAAGSAGLSDEQIIQVGAQAGLTGDEFAQCVQDGDYRSWVGRNTEVAANRGVQSTPTVLVSGEQLPQLSVEALVAAVAAAQPS